MKITKRQLKRIIKEERQRLSEMMTHDAATLQAAHKQFFDQGFDKYSSPYYVEYDPDITDGRPWIVLGDDMLVYDSAANEMDANEYAEDLNLAFRAFARRQAKNVRESKQESLNENVPSSLGMEILSIKDALFDILMGVRYHDEELAADLELQIERLRELGYKKA